MRIGQYALLLAFVINFSQTGFSQQVTVTSTAISMQTIPNRGCGTPALPQQFETWVQGLTNVQTGKVKGGPGQTMSVFNIPVIVHVVHNNESLNSTSATSGGNLNATQIYDQIAILNRDFNGLNPDTSNIPTVFKPLLGKFQFNFCLAVVNPTGGVLAEPGIDRINRTTKGWTAPPYTANYVNSTIKPGSIWDPTKYLNMWVLSLGNNLLGFATFPNPGTSGLGGIPSPYGSMTNDGLVMRSNAFGSIGTAAGGNFNLGRTAVHELGHWLGLRHIWGDANCGNDFCSDTPPAQSSNIGCPTHPLKLGTCTGNSTGEMFMNYMDYTYDACMYMFTNDQKNRAQLIMTHSPMRASLLTSTVCNTPTVTNEIGLLYVHSPTYSQVINCNNYITPTVVMHNFGSNTVTSATYSYNVNGSGTQTVSWIGSLLPGASATVALPVVSNLGNGVHQYNVGVYLPNGQNDPYMTNNYNNQQFSIVGSFAVNVSTPPAICAGSGVTLTASGGASSYTWYPAAVTGSVANFNPLSSTIYTLSGSNGTCINSSTVGVSVLPLPLVTVNSPTICNGGSGVLATTGACTYTWLPGNITGSIMNVSPSVTTQYTLMAEGCNGCRVIRTTTTTVIQTPSLSILVSPSGSLCTGGSATLTASGASTYSWNTGATASAIVVSPTSNTSYSVTGNAGACQATASAIVNVGSSSLNIAVSPNPATVCAGNPIILNASGAGSYSWSTGSNSSSLTITPISNISYTINGTNGVCSASTVVNVSIVSNPVIAISAQPATSVCAGTTVQLSATGAASYSWSSGHNSAVALVTPTAAGVYSVTGYSQGCPGTATIAIGISGSTLGFTASANPSVLCAGNPATLSANGLSSYTWSGSGSPGDYVVSPDSTTTYSLNGSDGNCSAFATIQVTVVPPPSFTIAASTFSVCSGQSATVTAAGPYTNYLWQPASSAGSVFVISPTSHTTYTVNAGGAPGGCNSSSVFAISVTSGPKAILSTTSTVCGEPCEGAIQATVSEGIPPFTYSIPASSCSTLPCNNLCEGLYTLHTTDSAGCSTFNYFSIGCLVKTGMAGNSAITNFSIHPNPATDNIILSLPGHFSCVILNELGQMVDRRDNCKNEENIPLLGYAPGIYLIRITQNDTTIHRKIIKQ